MSTKSSVEIDNKFIAQQLLQYLGDMSYSEIASATGFNAETVRRYIRDGSKISASFVRRASKVYRLDANLLLLGHLAPANNKDLRFVSTESLMLEIGARLGRIEDALVGISMHNKLSSEAEVKREPSVSSSP